MLNCLIQIRMMTLPASCRGKAQGYAGEVGEHYLVILSAALRASAPRGSSVLRLSCSVNHGFNIYLTIQYLPRRFAAGVTEEYRGEDPIKHSLHDTLKGEAGGRKGGGGCLVCCGETLMQGVLEPSQSRCSERVSANLFCVGFTRLVTHILSDVYRHYERAAHI